MPSIQMLNPDSLGKPLGQYSQITRVKASEFLFIAGQVGADRDGRTPADFDAQCAQVPSPPPFSPPSITCSKTEPSTRISVPTISTAVPRSRKPSAW